MLNGLEYHRTSSTSSVNSLTGKTPRPNARTQSTGTATKKPPISPLALSPTSEEAEISQKLKRDDLRPKSYSVPSINHPSVPEQVPNSHEPVPNSPDTIPISVEERAKRKFILKGLFFVIIIFACFLFFINQFHLHVIN